MDRRDRTGNRGENIFRYLITKWCGGNQWFTETFLGEKSEAKDFLLNLIDPSSGDAICYVQVKSTVRGAYKKGQKLRGSVKQSDIAKLKKLKAPVYVVGVDVVAEMAYIVGWPLSNRWHFHQASARLHGD